MHYSSGMTIPSVFMLREKFNILLTPHCTLMLPLKDCNPTYIRIHSGARGRATRCKYPLAGFYAKLPHLILQAAYRNLPPTRLHHLHAE